jgi:hypothetical protein
MVASNAALGLLLDGVAPELLEPPVNVLRVSLHPDGVAPRIANLPEWRAHLLDRLGQRRGGSGDPALAALYDELSALPAAAAPSWPTGVGRSPCRCGLRAGDHELTFLSTVTRFGSPTDITVAELSIESFFPADAATAAALRAFAAA